MGKIDTEKMAAERAKKNAGGEMWDAPEGETRIYVGALPRPEDDLPYVETRMHYGLGNSAKSSHICLEPAINSLLRSSPFQEALEVLKKSIGKGCETCDRRDRGESVSGDPDQDGKPQSRYLWLISPRGFRPNARDGWTPPKEDIVRGFFVGYRVWDGLMDQFGQCEDITDMERAIFPRIIREGTKMSTKWEVQPDMESARKPVKLPKQFRDLFIEQTAPGAQFDPIRMLAVMLKTPEDVAKIHTEDAKSGEYEESPKSDGKHQPPVKGKSQAQVPADKPKPAPAKPAPAKPPAAASGTKSTPAKPAPAKPVAGGTAKANAQLKQLIAQAGSQPPGCYSVDPDPEAAICVGGTDPQTEAEHEPCAFRHLCFDSCGVQLPEPEPEPETDANDDQAAAEVAGEPEAMTVEQCVKGEQYVVNGVTATYDVHVPGKGHYFIGADNKKFKVADGTTVDAPEEEAPPAEDEQPEEDPAESERLAALQRKLAEQKQKKAGGTAKK
jgi:hypothetical protein